MRRRRFITLLGSAAVAWPLTAWAQQGERIRRIGVLAGGGRADDPDAQARNAAFLQGLALLGWTVGRNVRIDARWGLANTDHIRKYAAELVALEPDVILAGGTATVAPLLQVNGRKRAWINTLLIRSAMEGPPSSLKHAGSSTP